MNAALALAGMKGAGGLLSAFGTYQSNIAQAQQLRAQAELNRKYAEETKRLAAIEASNLRQAGFEQRLGILNQTQLARVAQAIEGERTVGAIRARAGASGADVGGGTPAQVEYAQRYTNKLRDMQTRMQGQRNAAVAMLNANRQADSLLRQSEFQAMQMRDKATLLTAQAQGLDQTRGLSVFSALLGAGSSATSGYYQGKQYDTP